MLHLFVCYLNVTPTFFSSFKWNREVLDMTLTLTTTKYIKSQYYLKNIKDRERKKEKKTGVGGGGGGATKIHSFLHFNAQWTVKGRVGITKFTQSQPESG